MVCFRKLQSFFHQQRVFTRNTSSLFSNFYIVVFGQSIFYGFYWHAPVILDQTYDQRKTTNYVETALTMQTYGILHWVIIVLHDDFSTNTCEFVAYVHTYIHACDFQQITNEWMYTCFVYFQMNSKHILNVSHYEQAAAESVAPHQYILKVIASHFSLQFSRLSDKAQEE